MVKLKLFEEQQARIMRQPRERHPPVWMEDYVSGGNASGDRLDEDETNMALTVSTDPLFYEEVVMNITWRMAMKNENDSIEKNKTWTLNKLPLGAKENRGKVDL